MTQWIVWISRGAGPDFYLSIWTQVDLESIAEYQGKALAEQLQGYFITVERAPGNRA